MNVLTEWLAQYFDEEEPIDFYRAIFPEGELDKKDAYTSGKYTGIIVAVTKDRKKDGTPKVKRYTITDELDAVKAVLQTDDFCLCSPISYAGKERTASAARYLYGIAVDMDNIKVKDGKPVGLIDLWGGHIINAERIPKPTYIVSSGSGLHLYYVLQKPVPMYTRIAKQLQRLKHELTRLIWNEGLVNIQDDRDIQQEGIYQGFRMPGTITKDGNRARAFLTGEKVTLEYLNGFVPQKDRVTDFEYKSKLTLSEAKAKYPEWYEARIERQEGRKYWNVNRALYDWWKDKILSEGRVGHRYFCLSTLSMYAAKCSRYDPKHNPQPVTQEELERDAFKIMEHFESLTVSADNHFTTADVLAALEAYQDRWNTYPREAVEYRSGILIQANKRNGQRQAEHLEEARAIRDIRCKRRGEAWDAHNGRKPKRDIVLTWRKEHPKGRKADCIRDTGCDRKTVSKYWLEDWRSYTPE